MSITTKILVAIVLLIISVTMYLILLFFFSKSAPDTSTETCPDPDVGWVQFGRIMSASAAITSLCVIIYLGILFAGKAYIKVETAGLIG